MGFFDFFKSFGSQEQKFLSLQQNPYQLPDYTKNDFQNLSNHAFGGNDLVYTGLTIRANSFIEASLSIRDTDKELLVGDPRLAVFLSPNDYQSGLEFMKMVVHHMDIDGNAFIQKGRTSKGRVQELHLLRPDRVIIVLSAEGGQMVDHYLYRIGGQPDTRIEPEEMLHIKTSNPYNPWRGMSPLTPILKHIDTDSEARDFTKALLENKAAPGGFLKVIDQMTTDGMSRLLEMFRQRFGGNNRGNIGVLEGNVEFISTSMNMQELNFSHITELTESRILCALGLNPVQVGVLSGQSGSTFNNVAEANLNFYRQTIIPLQRLIAAAINKDEDFNNNNDIEFFFDTSDVGALAPLRDRRVESLLLAHEKANAVTVNEIREALGQTPVDGGDELTDPVAPIPTAVVEDDTAPLEEELNRNQDKKSLETKSELEIETEWAASIRKAADKGFKETHRWAVEEYEKMYQDMSFEIQSLSKAFKDPMQDFEDKIPSLVDAWKSRIKQDKELPLASITREVLKTQGTDRLNISLTMVNEQVDQAVQEYTYKFADRISNTAGKKIKSIISQSREAGLSLDEVKQALHQEFTGSLSEKAAARIARTETVRAANEGVLAHYKASGVEEVRWLAAGDSCPYCTALDGQTAVTGESFVKGSFQPEGTTRPLDTSYVGGYLPVPPAHPNCQCTIMESNI